MRDVSMHLSTSSSSSLHHLCTSLITSAVLSHQHHPLPLSHLPHTLSLPPLPPHSHSFSFSFLRCSTRVDISVSPVSAMSSECAFVNSQPSREESAAFVCITDVLSHPHPSLHSHSHTHLSLSVSLNIFCFHILIYLFYLIYYSPLHLCDTT